MQEVGELFLLEGAEELVEEELLAHSCQML
jgi:hypothetical protein